MKPVYVIKFKPSDELEHAGTKGMKWGVRRFQNPDGSLTPEGKKRYAKQGDKAGNEAYDKAVKKHLAVHPDDPDGAKKAGTQAYASAAKSARLDVDAMVKEDRDAAETILREGSSAARTTAQAIRNAKTNVKRMDLSEITDAELRNRIERERLESQYDQMFNAKRHKVERGKQRVADIIDGVGTGLTLAGSAAAIALALKQLGVIKN